MANPSNQSVKYRVSFTQELLIKSAAATLDVIGFLLMLTVVGEIATVIIGITGGALFFIWFWFLGVNYFGQNATSKVGMTIINFILESAPFINAVYPGFSVQAWRLISIMKKEDEEKAKKRNQRAAAGEAEQYFARKQRVEAAQAQQIQAANDNAAEED